MPSPGIFDHHVAGIIDQIGVVAGTAMHRVGTGAAVQPVGEHPANQDVVLRIAISKEFLGVPR